MHSEASSGCSPGMTQPLVIAVQACCAFPGQTMYSVVYTASSSQNGQEPVQACTVRESVNAPDLHNSCCVLSPSERSTAWSPSFALEREVSASCMRHTSLLHAAVIACLHPHFISSCIFLQIPLGGRPKIHMGFEIPCSVNP